jgi:NAD(P)-dependent dehydrogenase (short-subunit alcohol dehydrogenase family)
MAGLTLVTVPAAIEPALRSVLEDPPFPTLVAGPGDAQVGPFIELAQSQWDEAIDGMTGAFRAARDAAATMIKNGEGGRIVLLSNPPAVRPVHGATLAATGGGFLTTAAQVAAAELAEHGITSNVVVAGWTEGSGFVEGIPAGRLALPEEIAAFVACLARAAPSTDTGAFNPVVGGLTNTNTAGGSPLLR